MKKNGIIAIILCLTMILSNSGLVFADTINKTAIKSVNVNSKAVNFDSENYFFLDDSSRTMAPIRLLCESLGATVSWDNDTKTATVVKDDKTVQITIGQKVILVNGKETPIDTTAKLVGGKTFLPLRAISEAMGYYVYASGSVKNGMDINITTEEIATNTSGSLSVKKLTELTAFNKAITDNGCTTDDISGITTIVGTGDGGLGFNKTSRGYRITGLYMSNDKHCAITKAFLTGILPSNASSDLIKMMDTFNYNYKNMNNTDWRAYYDSIENSKTYKYGNINIWIVKNHYTGTDIEIWQ